MARISITEPRKNLSEYLRRVMRGETIEITDRGRVVATLHAPVAAVEDEDERLTRLEQERVIRRPLAKRDPRWRDDRPVPCDGDIVQILIEQRGDR